MRKSSFAVLLITPLCMWLPSAHCAIFGVADARTQGLGGTAVALGNYNQGYSYNPALLATHIGDEDETQDGHISYVALVDGLSDGAKTAASAITDDLEDNLSEAIDALNIDTNALSARSAIADARDLREAMNELEQQSIYADVYTAVSLTEPGDREGGAFFINSRLLAVGDSNIEQSDLALLDDYIEALTYIETFGSAGEPHPELLDGDGNFVNPSDNIDSSAEGSALMISEVGVSAARQFTIWGQPVAVGVTPKAVILHSFHERWGVDDGQFDNDSSREEQVFFNADIGLLWTYQEHWRVGLAVKDVLEKRWTSELNQSFKLSPKSRLGLAYWGEYLRIGMDADLQSQPQLQSGIAAQDLTFGVEWQALSGVALRLGYRYDLKEILGNSSSAGLLLRLGRFALELSASSGDYDLGAALQFSYYH